MISVSGWTRQRVGVPGVIAGALATVLGVLAVLTPTTGAVYVQATSNTANAITSSSWGPVQTWGTNFEGHLGDGTLSAGRSSPGDSLTDRFFTTVDAGYRHTCAIRAPGTLWCWGYNVAGQLGLGDTGTRVSPTQVGTASTWTAISTADALDPGAVRTCGIQAPGTIWCWGNGVTTPTQVGSGTAWASVDVGQSHSCALRTDGTIWCWGTNPFGQLGSGDTTDHPTPTQVGTATDWASVRTGRDHTCGVRTTGDLWCWGSNPDGRVGNNTTAPQYSPVQVGAGITWSRVFPGYQTTCGIRSTGALWCWGDNSNYQYGNGTTTGALIPVEVDTTRVWRTLGVDYFFSCGVTSTAALFCWGSNPYGQLGTGDTTTRPTPVRVGTQSWTHVAVGPVHTAGILGPPPA